LLGKERGWGCAVGSICVPTRRVGTSEKYYYSTQHSFRCPIPILSNRTTWL